MSQSDKQDNVPMGLMFQSNHELLNAINLSADHKYDFLVLPIRQPDSVVDSMQCEEAKRFLSYYDLSLTSQQWSKNIVGYISDMPIDAASNWDQYRRHFSDQMACAQHLSLCSVMANLTSVDHMQLALCVSSYLSRSSVPVGSFWAALPMAAPGDCVCLSSCNSHGSNGSDTVNDAAANSDEAASKTSNSQTPILNGEKPGPWHWWNSLRSLCGYSNRLGIALQFVADIPDETAIRRWLGEPIKCLMLSTDVFLTNEAGFPVLSKAHQRLFFRFLSLHPVVLLCPSTTHMPLVNYFEYLRYLISVRPEMSVYDRTCRGYEDYLQFPLQPLKDNLEAGTYDVFEQDPVKYAQYQSAIVEFFTDWKEQNGTKMERDPAEPLVAMVVGAGRGPLVTACIRAAKEVDVKMQLFAVEKHSVVVHTLRQRAKEDALWIEQGVTVVLTDMRTWETDVRADLLVSELLGSFGDNELSPECLDGAQRFLKPGGVIIPQKYSSYIAPLQSMKLHCSISDCQGRYERFKPPEYYFEIPYVVKLHNCFVFADPKRVFTFSHPKPAGASPTNEAYAALEFKASCDCILTGFAGYFEANLYRNIMISTRPSTHSPDMCSWFPFLLPLREPIQVKCGENIKFHVWRLANSRECWYEWTVSEPSATNIHNPNGRSYSIGL